MSTPADVGDIAFSTYGGWRGFIYNGATRMGGNRRKCRNPEGRLTSQTLYHKGFRPTRLMGAVVIYLQWHYKSGAPSGHTLR